VDNNCFLVQAYKFDKIVSEQPFTSLNHCLQHSFPESNFRLSKEFNLSIASSPSYSTISSPLSQQSRARSSTVTTMTHFQFPADQPANNGNAKATLVHQNSTKENQGPASPAIKRVSTRKSSFLNTPVSGLSSPKPLTAIKLEEAKVPVTTVTPCEEADNELYADGYYHCKNTTKEDGYYRLPVSPKTEAKGPQRISLAMSICTENLKIVRMLNRFW
jgi:hypothetical protein